MYISKSWLVFIGLFVVLLICLTYAWAQNINQGAHLYTPTRLQSLALELQAKYHMHSSEHGNSGIQVNYLHDYKDTIIVSVGYLPHTDRAFLNKVVEAKKSWVKEVAGLHDWDTWVKVKENVTMME